MRLPNPAVEEYHAFSNAAGQLFDELRAQQRTTKEALAGLICTAATDGKDTLRYTIGNDGYRERMDARAAMADQDYTDYIKSGFRRYR